MTHPIDPHEPAPEFMAHLEWQVRTALRRETRLASTVRGGVRRLQAAAVIAASVMFGAAGGVASGEIQDARQRESLIQSTQAGEALLRLRYELAKADYEAARRRFETGVAGRESVADAVEQMRATATSIKRLQINLAEIQATSAPPRDDLDAPLVGKRDFVRERLMLDLEAAQHTLVAAERSLAEARSRVAVGVASDSARLQAEADVAHGQEQMQSLRSRLELRERYLRGELQAPDLALAQRRAELTLALERAGRELALGRERHELLRKQVAVGLAHQLEAMRAEIAVLEREMELQRIRAELTALGSRRD